MNDRELIWSLCNEISVEMKDNQFSHFWNEEIWPRWAEKHLQLPNNGAPSTMLSDFVICMEQIAMDE